jgi:hypothetical protein
MAPTIRRLREVLLAIGLRVRQPAVVGFHRSLGFSTEGASRRVDTLAS